jgi:hypothetical protein
VGVDEWVPALNLDHLAERNSPAGHNPRATTSFAAHIEMPEAIAV